MFWYSYYRIDIRIIVYNINSNQFNHKKYNRPLYFVIYIQKIPNKNPNLSIILHSWFFLVPSVSSTPSRFSLIHPLPNRTKIWKIMAATAVMRAMRRNEITSPFSTLRSVCFLISLVTSSRTIVLASLSVVLNLFFYCCCFDFRTMYVSPFLWFF